MSGPPKTLPEWIAYLHTARAVPQDSPDYGDAQEAVRFALQRIQSMNAIANSGDQAAAEQGKRIGALGAGTANVLNAAGAGSGEPIAGLIDALLGGSVGAGAGRYRQGLENIGTQHPVASSIGDVLGMGAMAGVPVGEGVQGGTKLAQGAKAGMRGPNVLSRFLTGAMHTDVAPGLALGGIQGFSAGGEDPGDMRARLQGGAVGAGTGAAAQAFFGGLGALRVPRWISDVRKEIRAEMPKGTPPALVNEVEEAAIRAKMTQDHYSPEVQDRMLAAVRAGKTMVRPPLPPPTTRPGETITATPPKVSPASLLQPGNKVSQVAPQGLEVTGVDTRPIPPEPPAISLEQAQERAARAGKRPGHPIFRGEGSPTSSKAVRGGEPLTPSAAGVQGTTSAKAQFARFSNDDLLGLLTGPKAASDMSVRQTIRAELIRRLGLK